MATEVATEVTLTLSIDGGEVRAREGLSVFEAISEAGLISPPSATTPL